ncbi:hypothetical protein V6N13_140658 [Hibiscus sabdariffa]
MTEVLKRPSSKILDGIQPLQKKSRKWEESTIVVDVLIEAVSGDKLENEILRSGIGGKVEGSRSADVPSFKDKLLGNAGKNGQELGLGELDVEV